MPRAVWKYEIDIGAEPFTRRMPVNAQVLHVEAQDNRPCFWALVHDDRGWPADERTFQVFGTGHELPPRAATFCGTFQLDGGAFIGHLFEVV